MMDNLMRENDSTSGSGPPRRGPARIGIDLVAPGGAAPASNNPGARPRARRGLGIIWVIVFLLLLAAFLAGGVDYAWLVEHKSRAQTAAEAAGLAGAQDLGIGRDAAIGSAIATARLNPGTLDEVVVTGNSEGVGGDVRFGRWIEEERRFIAELLASNAVEVTVRFRDDHPNGPVELIFGELLVGSVGLDAKAVAYRRPIMPVPGRLWILDDTQDALLVRTGGHLHTNGACAIPANETDSVRVESGGMIQATLLELAGTVTVDSEDAVVGTLREAVPDSEASLLQPPAFPPPPIESLPVRFQQAQPRDLAPGHYPEGILVTTGTWRMRDGVYRIGGPGLRMGGTGRLETDRALVCIDPESSLILDGDAVAVLDAPAPDEFGGDPGGLGAWSGVSLMATGDGQGPVIEVTEEARLVSGGALVLPEGLLRVDGGECRCPLLVVQRLVVEDQGLLRADPEQAEPHPHEHLLVQ